MASMRKKKGNYYARFYDKRRSPKRKEVPLRTTRKDVARRLSEMERKFERGAFDPWTPESGPEKLTVGEALERFLKAKAHLRPSTLDDYRINLEAWARDHTPPALMLSSLAEGHLRPYVHGSDVAQSTRRKRYRYLRTLLNWTVKAGMLDGSPLRNVRQPKEHRKQAAFLTTADLERLLRAIDAHMEVTEDIAGRTPDLVWLRDMIVVGVCTGLRRAELARLRWTDVNLEAGLLTVRSRGGAQTKSGHERQLPIAPDALGVLRRLRAARTDELDGPVFTDRTGLPVRLNRISQRFKDMIRVAKLDDRLHFHSLRHTCGSWLAMKGVPMRVIQGILGHSTLSVTERYSHLQPEVMQKAIQETFG